MKGHRLALPREVPQSGNIKDLAESLAENPFNDLQGVSAATPKLLSPTAERMRRYRQRRRQGLQCVPIPLQVTEVDDLIRLGLLKKEQREDQEAQGSLRSPTDGTRNERAGL